MIQIDISTAISLVISLILILFFGAWLNYNFKNDGGKVDPSQHLLQCPFCTHLFFDEHAETIKTCPKCQSYFNPGESDQPHKIT